MKFQSMGNLLKKIEYYFNKYSNLFHTKLSGIGQSIHDFLSDTLYDDS